MDPTPSRDEEKIAAITENLRMLTEKQIDTIWGFVINCVNKNLLDEVRAILKDNKNF